MLAVILRPDWPGTFRRSVRDVETGAILRTLEFKHFEPQLLEGLDAEAVKGDLGKALFPPAVDANGNPLTKPDYKKVEADKAASTQAEESGEEKARPRRRR